MVLARRARKMRIIANNEVKAECSVKLILLELIIAFLHLIKVLRLPQN